MITLPIEIGDVILTGKFKNHKVTVKEIGTDENGLPTVNGKGILKVRIQKLMQKKENISEAVNDPKVERLVRELNALIKSAVDSDGDPIPVVDRSSTWEEPYVYEPVVYNNGTLKIMSKSQYNNKPEVTKVLERDMEFEGIPQLMDIIRQYKYAIKKNKSSSPIKEIGNRNDFLKFSTKKADPKTVNSITSYIDTTPAEYSFDEDEGTLSVQYHKLDRDAQELVVANLGHHIVENKMKLTKKESIAVKKTIKKRISEGIDNRSIDVKIKKENGTYWFFLQHDEGEEENITNVGFETIELARHAARMKGFNIVGDKDDKQKDSFNKLPDSATPPKPTAREKTPNTEKPKEIDLGKEKTIELEEHVKRIIREEVERFLQKKNSINEAYTEKDLKFVNGKAVLKNGRKIVAKVYDRAVYYPANNLKSSYPKNEPYSLEMSMGSRGCSSLEEVLKFLNKYLSESVISEAGKITKKIETALRELKDLQDKIAAAQAQIEKIKKDTGLDALQKKADELLKVQLWDFLEELKKDETRIVKLKDLVLRINRHQASPATYEYEKVLDFVMTQVNQDVKEKILAELKTYEKIGKTKANVSFTTEASGGTWDSILNFLGKFIPALKKKGEKIDNDIEKAEAALSNIE